MYVRFNKNNKQKEVSRFHFLIFHSKKLKMSAMSRTEFEKGAKCIIKIEKAKSANLWNRQTKTDIEFERIISTFRSFCLFLASILRPF